MSRKKSFFSSKFAVRSLKKRWVSAALFLFVFLFLLGRPSGKPGTTTGKRNLDDQSPPFKGPHETSLDRIYFGIGSSAGSIDRVAKYGSVWLKGDVRYTILVDEIPDDIDPEVRKHTKVSSASKHPWWFETKMDFHTRLAWSIWDLFEAGYTDVDWFVVTDDDGIWFVDGLLAVLSKYDPTLLWYLGNWSEDAHQVVIHGLMAYGGGGYAISYPLAKLLHETLAACLPRYDSVYGQDARIFACVSELGVGLSREEGFHQMDLTGDVRGFLEAHPQAPLCSLHHLQQLEPVFPHLSTMHGLQMLMDAAKELGHNMMQQWVTTNRANSWTFSIAQGYSLKWWEKPKLVTWVKQTELTFDRFMHKKHYGPQDWTISTRRGMRECRHHDVFYWTGLAADGVRHIYVRSNNPHCVSFLHIQMIFVTPLPGTFYGRQCEIPASKAKLTPQLELELCGTYQSFKLQFSGSSIEREPDSPEVQAAIYNALLVDDDNAS